MGGPSISETTAGGPAVEAHTSRRWRRGLTSFATSWMTQQAQTRNQRRAAKKEKREKLFGRFVDEAARPYADALQNKRDNASAMMVIYGLTDRIRLISSQPVVASADNVARIQVLTENAWRRGRFPVRQSTAPKTKRRMKPGLPGRQAALDAFRRAIHF
jgi:hypothetical protein